MEDFISPAVLSQLGLDIQQEYQYHLIRERTKHRVWRIWQGGASYILKSFQPGSDPLEIKVYRLLNDLDVPILPVHGWSDHALLIEDLSVSPCWRAAEPEDMCRPDVGRALSKWYRQLHQAGFHFQAAGEIPPFLISWVDELSAPLLDAAGEKLGMAGQADWLRAVEQLGALQRKYHAIPHTFNYADFTAENLALARAGSGPIQAVMYDYDCFRIGTAYSDVRNVVSGLEGEAIKTFRQSYGLLDTAQEPLDTVLGLLEGIQIAAQRDPFPFWAAPLIEDIVNGALARSLDQALAA